MKNRIFVVKANGQRVPFNINKVVGICIRAGASQKIAKKIARKTKQMIKSGISTRDVYRIVLRNSSEFDETRVIKHRYELKESIMKMGQQDLPLNPIWPKFFLIIDMILKESERKFVEDV